MIDFFTSAGHAIMVPLYYVTSGIMLAFHELFHGVLGVPPGISWGLSIIFLTVVIRACLIPLYVKQIKASRAMQLIQPQVKELQKKYGHDRERLTQETMKLYKESGTNPFASCLPLILQMPIFFALFRTLENAARNDTPVGFFTQAHVTSMTHSSIGPIHISDSFTSTDDITVKIITGCLIALMVITTFFMQRQLMTKNMPASAMSGQYAQAQKMMLYVLPLVFIIGGVAFPLGVLFYWVTSNTWSMGQNLYVIHNNPTPGTPAYEAKKKRDEAKAARKHGGALPEGAGATAETSEPTPPKPPQRTQPKRQSRSQRNKKKKRKR